MGWSLGQGRPPCELYPLHSLIVYAVALGIKTDKPILGQPGGQDTQTTVKGTATRIDARYLMQTSDEHPAMIICIIKGWLTADRDVMERLQDPVAADNVAANRYKLRVTIELETGDERYQEINTGVWVGSGCRRGAEIVYDAYRIG